MLQVVLLLLQLSLKLPGLIQNALQVPDLSGVQGCSLTETQEQ